MKPKFVAYPFAIFLFIVQPLFAASETQREFDRLTQEREKALAAAAEPINRRFVAALEPLLKKATQANDLETALTIKQSIERISAQLPNSGSRANSEVVGSWHFENLADGNKGTWEINADGTFGSPGNRLGTWEVKSRQLIFKWENRPGHFDRYDLPVRGGVLKGTNTPGQKITLTRQP
jgi:hypothetical protein